MQGAFPQAPTANYGAMPGYGDAPMQAFDPPLKSPFFRGPRKFPSMLLLLNSVLLPWVVFCVVLSVESFTLHYTQPELVRAVVGVLMVFVLLLGYFAFTTFRRRAEFGTECVWYGFLFVMSLAAWIVALAVGQENFKQNMVPYLDTLNLNVYPSIDPAKHRGGQLMDAGRITFTENTYLDLSKSMGFRNEDMYCVAPIVSGTPSSTRSFDFWAVGTNCCSGHAADFHCGEYHSKRAHSGLRLMRDDERAYFRLAVQQAEAAFNIRASHPIFLHWMEDPLVEMHAYQDDTYKVFLVAGSLWLGLQLVLALLLMYVLSKVLQ